ncbi:HTH DNA binding protein [Staphylococcus phage PG-2021_40]
MIEIRQKGEQKVDISNGAEHLLKFLESNKNSDNKFLVSTKSELAKQYGLSLSTVSKRLTELINNKLITMITKKGKNGGIIISFLVQSLEEYSKWERKSENIITSESEYAKTLREQVFPKYERPLGNGRPRRTKKEMIAYRMAKDEQEQKLLDMNLECEVTYPSKRIFKMAPDPQGYFRAYILAKLYDVLCYAYMESTCEYFKNDIDQSSSTQESIKHYQKLMDKYKQSDILGRDFFGTRKFNTFYNLQAKLQEWGLIVHDFKYIHSVFGNYIYHYEQRRGTRNALGSPVPYINYFHSENTLKYFIKHVNQLRKNKAMYGFTKSIGQSISSVGANSLTYQSLKQLYDMGIDSITYDFDTKFMDALTITDIIDFQNVGISYDNENEQLNRNSIAYTNYNNVVNNLPKMLDKDKETLVKFLKQAHIQMANERTLSPLEKATMFPLQQRALVDAINDKGMKEKDEDLAYSIITTIKGEVRDDEIEPYSKIGREIESMYSLPNWWNILIMYGTYRDMTINANEIKRIIDKYDLENEIKLDIYGLIDYNKVVNDMLKEEKSTCHEE